MLHRQLIRQVLLPDRWHFDNRFQKVPSKIKAKLKTEIKLTDDIELVIRNGVQGLERTIKGHKEDDGSKYIMIRSDKGYEYAERFENHQLNQE